MGTFSDGLRELEERIGHGDLTGRVSFTGAAAVPLHEFPRRGPPTWEGKTELDYTAPGTGPGYLRDPLLERSARYMQAIADDLLEAGPRGAMEDAMDDLKAEAVRRVPKLSGDLARSARAQVRG